MSKPSLDYRSEIERLVSEFNVAANAKDAATIANMYSEDATLLPPGSPPIVGRQNIRNFWQAFMDAGTSDVLIRTHSVDASGEIACEIGEYGVTIPNAEGRPERSTGKYLVAWKRQADGSLKMVADMFSPNA